MFSPLIDEMRARRRVRQMRVERALDAAILAGVCLVALLATLPVFLSALN